MSVPAGAGERSIGADLRPDLTGGPVSGRGDAEARMAGDPTAKREFDAPPPL